VSYNMENSVLEDIVKALSSEDPDIVQIRELFTRGRIRRMRNTTEDRKFENLFNEVVKKAHNFLEWDPTDLFRNSVIVAAYLRYLNLKTNQVRKIFEIARTIERKVRREEQDIKPEIVKMRYLLAYIAGKGRGEALEAFQKVIDPILRVLMNSSESKNFLEFYEFLQAVLAYHRFFGGVE